MSCSISILTEKTVSLILQLIRFTMEPQRSTLTCVIKLQWQWILLFDLFLLYAGHIYISTCMQSSHFNQRVKANAVSLFKDNLEYNNKEKWTTVLNVHRVYKPASNQMHYCNVPF